MASSKHFSCRMSCSLFIPDFRRHFEAAGRPRLPALERMAARGASKRMSPAEFLAPRFGLEPGELKPAPFMYLGDTGTRDGEYRLCADFVHLAPDRDQLVLMPATLLDARREEFESLAAGFDALYGMEGWNLEVTPSGRAYLRAPRPLDLATWEPEAVAGSAVLDYMPTGEDASLLRQLMNESQMLFHTDPVNQAREEAGRPLINSLWIWGGGVVPHKSGVSPERVFSDLPLVRGLAAWADKEAEIPNRNIRWEAGDLFALGSNDPRSLDRDWFGPLLKDLQHGNIKRLHFYLGGLGSFELDTGQSHRFWRRPRPLTGAAE